MNDALIDKLIQTPLFSHMARENFSCLDFLKNGKEIWLQAGELLVAEGDPADFHVLLEGELQIAKKWAMRR